MNTKISCNSLQGYEVLNIILEYDFIVSSMCYMMVIVCRHLKCVTSFINATMQYRAGRLVSRRGSRYGVGNASLFLGFFVRVPVAQWSND